MAGIKILHPEFLKCLPFVKNDILFMFFKDIIAGIFPENAYINKNVFISKNKSFDNFRIDIEDAGELYEQTKNVISKSNKLNIELKKEKMFNFLKINPDISWSNIKKKKIKECLIDDFTESNKQKYNLTTKQIRFLIYYIYVCLIFKIIKPKDIQLSFLKIMKIKGINFDNKKFSIAENIYDDLTIINETPQIINDKNTMEYHWKHIMN